MADQKSRGGMKQNNGGKTQTGHQGVHPDSSTQSRAKDSKKTGSQNGPGMDPHAGEQIVPKKESYESDKA